MAVDAGLLLTAPDPIGAATDFGAALRLGAEFVAGRAFALGGLGWLGIPAIRVGLRTAANNGNAEEQEQSAKPHGTNYACWSRSPMFSHALPPRSTSRTS